MTCGVVALERLERALRVTFRHAGGFRSPDRRGSVPQAIALEEVPDEARRVNLAGDEPRPMWRSVRAGPRVPSVSDAI